MATRGSANITDEQLLAAARVAGDEGRQAASVLLERYQDRVYAWCYRMLRNHETALDAAQESLIAAYRDLGSFRGEAGFGTWIYSITRHRCLSAMRRPSLLIDEDADPDGRPAPGVAPDRQLEDRLDEEQLLELIKRHLDPLEQEALWLRCFEKTPVDEITRLLGITEASGARAVLQRARRRLRAALADQGIEGEGDPA